MVLQLEGESADVLDDFVRVGDGLPDCAINRSVPSKMRILSACLVSLRINILYVYTCIYFTESCTTLIQVSEFSKEICVDGLTHDAGGVFVIYKWEWLNQLPACLECKKCNNYVGGREPVVPPLGWNSTLNFAGPLFYWTTFGQPTLDQGSTLSPPRLDTPESCH